MPSFYQQSSNTEEQKSDIYEGKGVFKKYYTSCNVLLFLINKPGTEMMDIVTISPFMTGYNA